MPFPRTVLLGKLQSMRLHVFALTASTSVQRAVEVPRVPFTVGEAARQAGENRAAAWPVAVGRGPR